jgi:hypothetical protein
MAIEPAVPPLVVVLPRMGAAALLFSSNMDGCGGGGEWCKSKLLLPANAHARASSKIPIRWHMCIYMERKREQAPRLTHNIYCTFSQQYHHHHALGAGAHSPYRQQLTKTGMDAHVCLHCTHTHVCAYIMWGEKREEERPKKD